MASPPIPESMLRDAVALVEEFLRQGYAPHGVGGGRSSVQAAAKVAIARGMVRTEGAFRVRYQLAINAGIIPDLSLWAPARYHQPVPVSRLDPAPAPAPDASEPQGAGETVLIIPDLHQDPRHPHRIDVLTWVARFGRERDIQRVIQLGDWSTFDSVSVHDKNDTLKGRLKPAIRADLDNLAESLRAFHLGQGDWRPKLLCTYGNHDARLERFENFTPEAVGTFTRERDQAFAGFGWRTAGYGEIRYVEGVAVTHHAINGAGRAFGGKLGVTRSANETTCSIIHGHTHAWRFWNAPKIGPQSGVDILEAGCALPWGEIETYANFSQNDWWWGVTVAHLNAGRILDVERISMITLRKRYSDDGA